MIACSVYSKEKKVECKADYFFFIILQLLPLDFEKFNSQIMVK
jgi:hypothetical protein